VDSPVVAATGKVKDIKPASSVKEEPVEVHYEMDVKPSEAITTVFGSYGFKADDKKNITSIWMEGLGV
jgi:hypothetical protein